MASASSTPIITDDEINKLKIIHSLNTLGQAILLEVYQHVKPFPNSQSIKDHLIQDVHMPEHIFRNNFNATMINVIEGNTESGDTYDISLLIKCIKVLSMHYEPHSQWKWRNENELECRCQKLADKRNEVFHSFSGICTLDMRKQLNDIEKLLIDILDSLAMRFPMESTQMNDYKLNINDRISNILSQPLGKSEIRLCLLQKCIKIFRDEIPSYKTRCKEWGKLKILDFLLGNRTFHDIKILFTEVIVKQSNSHKKNTNVKCNDILILASSSCILLIDSEAGGGKTTIFRFGINDWGEGGIIMNTSGYDYIFPMIFRNPHICSVKELIKGLIPDITKHISMDNILDCIADPSFKILFFCDGYDEKNEKSLQLFSEICDLKEKYPHIRVVVTSRPESVREFYYNIGTDHYIEHLQVLGIHESKRGEFLKKYHDELIMVGLSNESTEELLLFFAQCSARHKDLYRLPINLVILAWLWGQNPDKARTIKSAAGLYTAIVDILNEKLIRRILQSHCDVMHNLKGDMDKLKDLIDSFKEMVYNESLAAVRYDRIFIDDTGVRTLREFCESHGLPFLELKGVYLLSKLEWENIHTLKEVLELPHKGFLDYYTAKCIESKLLQMKKNTIHLHEKCRDNSKNENETTTNSRENVIKKIILDVYGADYQKLNLAKYQNILQLLGGILALKDNDLVEEHGQEIIDLIIETGVRNNTQWYDIYNDFNLNEAAAAKFGKLIAPNLNIDNFTIDDANVEVLSTLIQYVDINEVSININSALMPTQLPNLISVLKNKQCHIRILNIRDEQVEMWNTSITQKAKICIDKVDIKDINTNLSFLSCTISITECYLQFLWRDLHISVPDMTEWPIKHLWTAVHTLDVLPTTMEVLGLGLLVDPVTRLALDPGLAHLKEHCPHLEHLGVHVTSGTVTSHLPNLPDITWINSKRRVRQGIKLFLSRLSDTHDLEWAICTTKSLQPEGGYQYLVFPSCGLSVDQLTELVRQMAAEGVTVHGGVEVSSPENDENKWMSLHHVTNAVLRCRLSWWENDDELRTSTGW
ncbi:unnamed protein product [Meganyctiphanes norvegica]|uniref:NACHT domain-containing protein n=1 Tax=Meganyctiphanes norvegica TaxID=48144 RepID=A0AAV2S922_MEGNR